MPSLWVILLLAGVGFLGGVAFFYGAAKRLLYNRDIHDLTVKSHSLRHAQIKRLAELRGSDVWDSAELVVEPGIEEAIDSYAEGEINVDIADEKGAFRDAA